MTTLIIIQHHQRTGVLRGAANRRRAREVQADVASPRLHGSAPARPQLLKAGNSRGQLDGPGLSRAAALSQNGYGRPPARPPLSRSA